MPTVEAAPPDGPTGIPAPQRLAPTPEAHAQRAEDAARWRQLWQRRMAPVMVGIILLLTLFFTGVSWWSYSKVEGQLTGNHNSQPAFDQATPTGSIDQLSQFYRQKAAVQLEQEIMEHRYEEVQAIEAGRTWVHFMGFVTGMILAMVGAAFVLGQLSDAGSNLQANGNGMGLAFTSSSPGLILALLGVTLMVMTIVINTPVSTTDIPTYFSALEPGDPTPEPAVTDDASNAAIQSEPVTP